MNCFQTIATMILVASVVPSAGAQSLSVDWLRVERPVDNRLLLFDDSSVSAGEVALITVAGFPIEVGANAEYEGQRFTSRETIPLSTDGNRTVSGFRMRIAPVGVFLTLGAALSRIRRRGSQL